MEDINLLENQLHADSGLKHKHFIGRAKKYLVLAVVGLLVLSGLFWGAGQYYLRAEKKVLARMEAARVELSQAAETQRDRVVKTQAQIQNLAALLPEHIYWHDFLTDIYSAAGEDIEITSINSSVEGFMNISGSVADFPQIADFTRTLEEVEYVESVKLNSSSLSESDGNVIYIFSLSVTFQKEALLFQNNDENEN